MSDEGSDADLRSLPNRSNDGDDLSLQVSPEELETLLSLDEAGVIDLDGIDLAETDPRRVEWTYEELKIHLVAEQGLRTSPDESASTVEQTLNQIRYLENPDDGPPVDLRPPDEESYRRHVYERKTQGATGTALNHYRLAMKRLLKFLNIPIWDCLEDPFEETSPDWTLPPEETVPRFWKEPLHDDPYLAATFAHIFHFGFNVGVRPPSEIVALDLEDVDFEARRIRVTEVKKGGDTRSIEGVSPYIITASNSRSLRNYVENWRPKVDPDEEKDAFFLNSEGERFGRDYLRIELSKRGKEVWPQFSPYTMRRFFATHFLMANDYNIYATAERLGDDVSTVKERYLEKARVRGGMQEQFSMSRIRSGSDGE